MRRQKPVFFDWALWFEWIMATTLGWVLGRLLFPNLSIVTIGLALGILQ
jgi:predicted branched-subunit amino acid permease